MIQKNILDLVIAIIIFLISASDFYKGILMVFRGRTPLLFIAQLSFGLLKLLPMSVQKVRYEQAINLYRERRKLYGIFALMGGPWGILLSILIFFNA